MNLLPWLHFVHVLSAIVWLGGGVILMLVVGYARSSSDHAATGLVARLLPFVGLRALTPAVVVLLVSGVWMVLSGVGWSFAQFWVQLAVGLFAVAFLVGAVYMSRTAIQLQRSVNDGAVANQLLGRWLVGYAVILLVLVVAVWDMVFKPAL